MSWFAVAVLCVLILTIIFYLMIIFWSFGAKLPKWITMLTWVFFIVCAVIATLLIISIETVDLPTIILIAINFLLWVYMLCVDKAPKRLKITTWIISIIIIMISIIACFEVPSMFWSVTLDIGLYWPMDLWGD